MAKLYTNTVVHAAINSVDLEYNVSEKFCTDYQIDAVYTD